MQNLGNLLDETGAKSITREKALSKCTELLETLKKDQVKAKAWLEKFYKEEW